MARRLSGEATGSVPASGTSMGVELAMSSGSMPEVAKMRSQMLPPGASSRAVARQLTRSCSTVAMMEYPFCRREQRSCSAAASSATCTARSTSLVNLGSPWIDAAKPPMSACGHSSSSRSRERPDSDEARLKTRPCCATRCAVGLRSPLLARSGTDACSWRAAWRPLARGAPEPRAGAPPGWSGGRAFGPGFQRAPLG